MKRFACCFNQRRQRSDPDEEDNRNPTGSGGSGATEAGPSVPPPTPQAPPDPVTIPVRDPLNLGGQTFTYAEILNATGRLQSSNKLGEGGFGEVFSGYMASIGKLVAVKFLDQLGRQGDPEFIAEVKMLQRANHPNLIDFLGHCTSGYHRVIVYEFMPLGSVDQYLYGQAQPLDWQTRMKIALGTARGLEYVHSTMNVIHRDIKAENILLDVGFVPKITDFGLAHEVQPEEEADGMPLRATRILGTPGYVAPEYERDGLLSFGCDIYSFGVFLIQLLTGREAYDLGRPQDKRNLVDWVRPLWDNEENLPLIADPKLGRRFPVGGLIRAFQTARLCVHPHATTRPDMEMVGSLISDAADFPIDPVPENTPDRGRNSM